MCIPNDARKQGEVHGIAPRECPSNYDYKSINLKKISIYCTGCFEAKFRCPILIWLNVISNKP